MFRPRASKGSHFSSSGSEGFTVHPSFGAVTSHVSSSGVEGFTFFVVGRRRVHIFVLGPRRVHVFRPRVREGSCFSSSGAEGFAFSVLGRRRVHIFGSCAPKGSHFSSSCVEGFAFSARGWPRRQRVRFFSQATGKKSGAQKMRFPYVVSNKKKAIFGFSAALGCQRDQLFNGQCCGLPKSSNPPAKW